MARPLHAKGRRPSWAGGDDDGYLDMARRLQGAVKAAKSRQAAMFAAVRRKATVGPARPVPLKHEDSRRSPFRGVSWVRRDSYWVARIKVDHVSKHLGLFPPGQEREAAVLYDFWAWHYFGASARLNFPEVSHEGEETVYVAPGPEPEPEPESTETRVCSRCLLPKPVTSFWKRRDRPSGRRSYCGDCGKIHYKGPLINRAMPLERLREEGARRGK